MSYYPTEEDLPPLGALCLDYTDDIHRPPGDVIMSSSYKWPVIHEKIIGATLWKVVDPNEFSEEYFQLYVQACKNLEAKGCIGIVTSCGFLAQIQGRLASAIDIPIATSSLLQIPYVLTIISPRKKVAVLTFDPSTLCKTHFNGVGITDDMMKRLVITGCKPGGPLHRIITDGDSYIHEELENELVNLAVELVNENSDIGAFVLECTQMPPFAKAIQKAVKLPVYDGVTMVNWFYSGLVCKTLPEDNEKEAGLRKRQRSKKEMK
ncbi:hypothetical protein C6P40_001651 [Pichia californica]|uniref:Aspartate/glutamate racemase family protein n=1 Tax=Pichia californica TaxID=460514 RepID=A0A9P7BG54_9ASCO|nr:hypothetical protein C6P42_000049 [[Candida] californica]KAG0691367.1 hypothetical protein C6P40_001651 [[Candida] californica]